MAAKPDQSDPFSTATKQASAEVSRMGEAQAGAMLAMQQELLGAYDQISRAWLERVKTEAELWSELATKMSRAGSVPDALGAYRDCVTQRMQMAADDGRRLLADTQKMMDTITRAMSNGWPKGGK